MDIEVLKKAQEEIIQAIQILEKAIQLETFHIETEPRNIRKFWGLRASPELEKEITRIMRKMDMIEELEHAHVLFTTTGIIVCIPRFRKDRIYSIEEIIAKLKELGDYATKERVLQKFREELERLK
jgi:uncharacterized protein (UPF0147 family)